MRAFVLTFTMTMMSISFVHAQQDIICTLVVDVASGATVVEEGDCRARVTPASTFKIPLAVMAYDAGILKSTDSPIMSFRKGDPDWGGANWKRDTTPADWMRYSVVWYSQRITHAMGRDALTNYAGKFGYGTADFSGDPGFDNGLDRAWISSSLQVSPREQAEFLRALVLNRLPVSNEAMANARAIVERVQAGDWTIHGKTGAAFPRRKDRSFDYARGWGWYVGWAETTDRELVFVRLAQSNQRSSKSPGHLTRDKFLSIWPTLIQ